MRLDDIAFPAALHYLVEHDVWARFEGEHEAVVGITALGIKLSGEIYMCRPRPVGSVVEQGRGIAVVELAKAIVSVKSAVGGTVLAVNARLTETPELVHRDPYGDGWIARIACSDAAADRARLVHGSAVVAAMARHAAGFGGPT
jgi:glycine cleavage system H protein